jgi:hypothetical protein
MIRSQTLKRVWGVIAVSWREATGLLAIKLALVLLASAYRGSQGLPPDRIREALLRFFDVDTAVFLASLPPVFLFLLMGNVLILPFIAVMFGAFGPSAREPGKARAAVLSDARVLPAALLLCELVTGLVPAVLVVRLVPEITLGVALKTQALIVAVAFFSVLPVTMAMVFLRSVTERRILLFSGGLGFALLVRYVLASAPASRWFSQRGIESLLMTGEVDRFALGALLAAAWTAVLVAAALAVARRLPTRRAGAARVAAVARISS